MGYSLKSIDVLGRYEHFPDPITLSFLGAAATPSYFAGVATNIGIGLGAYGAYKVGEAQAAEAKSQERIAEYNARIAAQEAQMEQQRLATAETAATSRIRAATGAAGALPEGAPLALEARQTEEFQLQQLLTQHRMQVEQDILGMQAGQFRQRQKAARRAGAIRAGATLLKGFGTAAQMGA